MAGMTREQLIAHIIEKARLMRLYSLDMALVAGSNGAHLGPGYSMAEITATLYFGVMRHDPENPRWPERDRVILSKGHGVLGYYTALAESGYFPIDMLKNFETKDSPLAGHPSMDLDLGIEASTGSLGHGLSIAVGLALAARMDQKDYVTYVLMGDGECNEGMVWESVMAARQFQLDNIVAIIDRNLLQSDGVSRDIMDLGNLAEKWRSFGWHVNEVEGHDVGQLLDALHYRSRPKGSPYAIIAHTVKGKGVSFFENDNAWHHAKLTMEQYRLAKVELEMAAEGGNAKCSP